MIFEDRHHAGRELAKKLGAYIDRDDVLVLALPRGGVPVAFEVAQALRAPLDVFVVRKLGMPGHEEFAIGAIASGGVRVVNADAHVLAGTGDAVLDRVAAREQVELERRERLYRGERALPPLAGRTVIVVDDGLATGSTMRAALQAIRALGPARLVAAIPVGVAESCEALRAEADAVVCLSAPSPFLGVGRWYRDFGQTGDDEVRRLLERAAQLQAATPAPRPAPAHGPAATLRRVALPLDAADASLDPLLERIGDARVVLLGEASHGTHEFYDVRARITRRLIAEKNFTAVAVEADWPDAYRVNRYVRGDGDDADADAALAGFERFPTWMWRNTVVRGFVEWLRAHNAARADAAPEVGFYGLDLYSLHTSVAAVLDYLRRHDPEAHERARYRYACFEHFGEDVQAYGYAASFGLGRSCEDAVVAQLVELSARADRNRPRRDDDLFFAEQNARLVRNAEAYYRAMFGSRAESWNLRDTHMMETLQSLMQLKRPDGRPMRIAVWAHNSHLGNARATEMGEQGELNLGQLVRDAYGDDAVLVGFSTHHGTVTAARDWGDRAHRKRVRAGLAGSFEALFHEVGLPAFQLRLDDAGTAAALATPRLQRAIGVIYRPETERMSHYFRATLPRQFDWMIHIDETRALTPLEPGERWHAGEPPETYPSGL